MNFFKGFVIGIGKIIPGVSGAMLAISMGIYDKALNYICEFNGNKKESIKYLFPICLGIILSIIFFSKIISLFLTNFYLITMLFFTGLIIGGVPNLVYKVEKNDCYVSCLSFIVFFAISISNIDNIYIVRNDFIDLMVFFFSGVLEAIGTVVPGVSSTALLMVIGTYNTIIFSIGNLTNFNILIPFCFGFVVGLFVIVKIVNYLFIRCKNKTNAFVLGVLISSVVLLIIQSLKSNFNFIQLIIGLLFMVVGIFLSNLIESRK